MTEFTIELAKVDENRSLVVWVKDQGRKFVVCSYYDKSRPIGIKWDWGHYFDDIFDAVDYIRKVQKNSQKDGKWILVEGVGYICSECGTIETSKEHNCPVCGANMEVK